MWDKLRIRERERMLGLLFVCILPAVFCVGLLARASPGAAAAVVGSILGTFWVVTLWRLVRLWQKKHDAAPIGPLSSDERQKARSKLLNGASRSMLTR